MIWIWLLVLLCCSGAVSASETALFSLSRLRLVELRQSASKGGRLVSRLMQRPRRVLNTVLIANTAINVAYFATSFIVSQSLAASHPVWAGVVAVGGLLALICVGEIVPKTVAMTNPIFWSMPAGRLISVLQKLLGPLRWFLRVVFITPLIRLLAPSSFHQGLITTNELNFLIKQSASDGVIDSNEQDMLEAIVAADEVSVREVMTPRVDIKYVRHDADRNQIVESIKQWGRRKIPVCGADLDDLRGVIVAREVFTSTRSEIERLIKPVVFVPEQVNIMQLLRHFRANAIEFAIVVDEFGGTTGLVSMDDVTRWFVGSAVLEDDRDRPDATVEEIDPDTYRVSGNLSARLWASQFALRDVDRRIDTVGGVVLALLGRLPVKGDSVRIRNLILTVEAVDKRRIVELLIQRDGIQRDDQSIASEGQAL